MTFEIRDFAIALIAKKLVPTALNIDFLKYSDIIPVDWQVARPPVYTNQLVQLAFQNGLSIVAQTNRVSFVESIADKNLEQLQAPAIAEKYIEKLPSIDYGAATITARGVLPFESDDAVHEFMYERILSKGSWQTFGLSRLKAGVQLQYELERGQLNFAINEGNLRKDEQAILPVVVFSGDFLYKLEDDLQGDILTALQAIVRNHSADLQLFKDLVVQHFLKSSAVRKDEGAIAS